GMVSTWLDRTYRTSQVMRAHKPRESPTTISNRFLPNVWSRPMEKASTKVPFRLPKQLYPLVLLLGFSMGLFLACNGSLNPSTRLPDGIDAAGPGLFRDVTAET